MTRSTIIMTTALFLFISATCTLAASPAPPYTSLKVYGKTKTTYNKVSLFSSGGASKPLKTFGVKSNGAYTLSVSIPRDMQKSDDHYFTDMRFWNDTNNNGIKDNGEPVSQCHFISWYPAPQKVFMQIYNGPTHELASPKFKYDYQ